MLEPSVCSRTIVILLLPEFQVATKRAAMRISKVIEDVNDAAKLAKLAAAGGLQDGQSPIKGIKIGITHVDPACCQNVDVLCQTDPAKWTYGTAIDGPFGRFSSSHRRAGYQGMVVVMGFLPSAIKETLSGWGHAFTVELFLHNENPLGFDLGTFNGKVDGKVDSKPGGKWMSKNVAVVYVTWRLRKEFMDLMPDGAAKPPPSPEKPSEKQWQGGAMAKTAATAPIAYASGGDQ